MNITRKEFTTGLPRMPAFSEDSSSVYSRVFDNIIKKHREEAKRSPDSPYTFLLENQSHRFATHNPKSHSVKVPPVKPLFPETNVRSQLLKKFRKTYHRSDNSSILKNQKNVLKVYLNTAKPPKLFLPPLKLPHKSEPAEDNKLPPQKEKMLSLISTQESLRKQCYKTLALSERKSRDNKQKKLISTFSSGLSKDLLFLNKKPGWVSALSNYSNNQTPKKGLCLKLVESPSRVQLTETPRLLRQTLSSFRSRGTSCDSTNELIQRIQLQSIFIGKNFEVKVFRHNEVFIFKLYADREYKDQVRLPLGELEDIIQYGIDDQSDERIGQILNEKLKRYLSVVLGVKLLINIPKKETVQIKEEEGATRVDSILSKLSSAEYNSFINSLKRVQERVRRKTVKEVQQLKKLREDRPPIITKGVVRLNKKFYRFAAFGEQNTPSIQLDFFDLQKREYSVKSKTLEVNEIANLLGPKASQEMESKYGKLRLVRNFLNKLREMSIVLSYSDLGQLIDLSLQVEEQ